MSDGSYNSIQAERELLKAVDSDPRVVAALEAKNAFYDSDAGKHLDAAVHGMETWSTLDEDIRDTLEAHTANYIRTRGIVKAELRSNFYHEEGEG